MSYLYLSELTQLLTFKACHFLCTSDTELYYICDLTYEDTILQHSFLKTATTTKIEVCECVRVRECVRVFMLSLIHI